MMKFIPGLWGSMFGGLTKIKMEASLEEPSGYIRDESRGQSVNMHLTTAIILGRSCRLPETERCASDLNQYFKDGPPHALPFKEIEIGIDHLLSLARSEMEKHLFYQIPPDLTGYYQTPKDSEPTLFGHVVDTAFPSVRNDVVNAGKSLACGLNNAAVYHLVCVAEIGLRVLAWDRRVQVKHNKKVVPLEFAQWGELINKIEPEVAAIKNWKSKPLSADAQRFYNRALVELRAFNAGWRTHVMHARDHMYQTDETVALFGHVKRFMETLAERLSEAQRTPKIWKRPTS